MKFTRITILAFMLFSLTSCVTDFLWGARDYKEEITQFYVGSDGRYVVLMGIDYHYVFTDNSGVLRDVLSLKQSGVLGLDSQTYFNLDQNNNLEGEIVLKGAADLLSNEDAIKLQVLGFLPDRKNNISIKLNLKGRRYSARYLGQQNNSQNIGNKYFIKIYYRKDTNFATGVGKAAITPVAITLDAALLIGKVVIYPFTLPYKQMGIE